MEMKLLAGYPNYGICPDGTVLNLKTGRALKSEITKKGKGYPRVTLCAYGETKRFFIHRLVAELFIPRKENDGTFVNHIDGNHLNCHISNLEWVTHRENVDHAMRTGLCPKGEDNGYSTHTDTQIHLVCTLLASKASTKHILEQTGASIHTVKKVRARRGWLHISRSYTW